MQCSFITLWPLIVSSCMQDFVSSFLSCVVCPEMGKMVYYYKLLLCTTNYITQPEDYYAKCQCTLHNMAKRFALDRLKKLNSKLPSFAFKDKRSQTKNKKCLSRPMPTRLSQSPFQFFSWLAASPLAIRDRLVGKSICPHETFMFIKNI